MSTKKDCPGLGWFLRMVILFGTLLLCGIIFLLLQGCMAVRWMQAHPDSVIEEKAEQALDAATGIDVDLTADSPEN